MCTLRHKNQTMFLRQVLKRLRNFGQKLDRMIFDAVGEAEDLLVKFRRHRRWTEFFKRVYECMSEAVESVSVLDDAFTFNVIKDLADLFGSEFVMIQEFDKARNGALEVDIVLPESVVGVDEESLGHASFELRATSLRVNRFVSR